MLNILRNHGLLDLRSNTLLSCHMGEPGAPAAMFVNNQLVRVAVDMNVFCVNYDIISVSKDLRHFLQGNSFRFGQNEEHDDCAKAGDDYKNLQQTCQLLVSF